LLFLRARSVLKHCLLVVAAAEWLMVAVAVVLAEEALGELQD
jgi:hypothetical protein